MKYLSILSIFALIFAYAVFGVVFFAVVFLGGCASPLDQAKWDVDHRLTYQNYAKNDFRVADKGNCAVYAATYQAEALSKGIQGAIKTCLLYNGSGHAFFMADNGQVLDVRQRGVGTLAGVGCVSGTVRGVK